MTAVSSVLAAACSAIRGTGFRCLPLIMTLWSLSLSAQAQQPTIRIEGASAALTDNIRAHLQVAEEGCEAPLRRLQRLRPGIRRNVERAGQAIGFYRLQHTLEFTRKEECWELFIQVTPGEPVTVATVDIDLPEAMRPLFRETIAEAPLQPGDVLNHGDYESLKTNLMTVAIENGYFDARYDRSRVNVDVAANTAAIILDFAPGQRYRFGTVRIGELDTLSPEFIQRFIPFEPDDPYSSEQLRTFRENLNSSQYFQQVTVTPRVTGSTDQTVPVEVALTPRLRRSYTAGAGVSTDDGPRLRLAYEDRYINRNGHRLNADLTVSPQRQEPSVGYVIPLRNPASESLRLSGGFQREETDSYAANAYRVGVSYRRNVGYNWVQTAFTNFQHERAVFPAGEEQTNATVSGINWSRTRSDDPIYPRRGWRLFGQVSGAHETLLSDISFLQFHGSAKLIRPLGAGRIHLRGDLASTLVDEARELPVSERFFAGGDQSVRGYEWNSLGARNEAGDVVGGKNLVVGSVEFDVPVYNNWHAAMFYDVGNSFDDFGNMTLRDSVGVGIRWMSPIGAIRGDIAHSLDDGSFRFHLTMGPDL